MGNGTEFKNQGNKDRGLKILVVDDDELSQHLLNLVLARNGNILMCSYDGYDAIKVLEEERFDLIFLDIQIPRINGFEVSEYVRARGILNAQTPIIALTAMSSRDKKVQNFLDNKILSGCIQKPFDTKQIEEMLNVVAQKKEIGLGVLKTDVTPSSNGKLVLNIEKVLPVFNNDMDAYVVLFDAFFATLPGRIKKLQQSENAGDWKKLSILAHNLTGVTRNFGAEKLSVLAEELDERAAHEDAYLVHNLIDKIEECIPELKEIYSTLIKREMRQSIRE